MLAALNWLVSWIRGCRRCHRLRVVGQPTSFATPCFQKVTLRVTRDACLCRLVTYIRPTPSAQGRVAHPDSDSNLVTHIVSVSLYGSLSAKFGDKPSAKLPMVPGRAWDAVLCQRNSFVVCWFFSMPRIRPSNHALWHTSYKIPRIPIRPPVFLPSILFRIL